MGTISDCRHLKVNLKEKFICMLTLLPKGVKKRIFPFATGVNDTGGAPRAKNISAYFQKYLKWPYCYTQVLGGNRFMKNTRSRKSLDTVPVNKINKMK